VRTQTLVKNAIIQIDAAPFKQWYQQHYGVELGLKAGKGAEDKAADAAETKVRQQQGC
jgi:small subunit ribosomal protein S8e